MITKISMDRSYVFTPAIHVVVRAEISGRPHVNSLKEAIRTAVKKFDILNCRILQDDSGECYYVRKEVDTEPDIEVRYFNQDSQEFINEQERIQFDIEQGKLQRYIISDVGDKMVLNIVQHHLAGDGKSVLLLIEEIMSNLESIEEKGNCGSENVEKVPVKVFTESYFKKFVQLNPLLEMSIKDLNSKWRSTEKFFTLEDLNQLFNKYWENRKTKVMSATIAGEELKTAVRLCKLHGVTINNLILTLAAKSFKKQVKMSVVANLRTDEFEGMGNYASCILIDALYDEKMDLWENALHIQKLVECQQLNKDQLLLGLLFKGTFESGLQDGVYFQAMDMIHSSIIDEYNDLAGFGTDGIPFCISNLGKNAVKEKYGRFGIEKVSFFSPLSPGLDCNMGVITVNGNMVINLLYSEENAVYSDIFNEVVMEICDLSEESFREEEEYEYVMA